MSGVLAESGVVFVVQHSYELEDDACETKLVGVYATEEAAWAAVAALRKQPGFCDYPDDFYVDRYPLNRTHWEEGFISMDDAE